MEEKFINYIDSLFAGVPQTENSYAVRSETLGRLTYKYRELISLGKTEAEAYSLAIASLGDTGAILARAGGQYTSPSFDSERAEKLRTKSAVLVSVAVALYILCPVPCILMGNNIGAVLLFVMVAAATGLIVFNAVAKKNYLRNDPTMKHAYEKKEESGVSKALSGALWAVTLVVYLNLSINSGAWHVTWLVFLIGAALDGVLKAVLELAGKD